MWKHQLYLINKLARFLVVLTKVTTQLTTTAILDYEGLLAWHE
jgi:hypothetical protein